MGIVVANLFVTLDGVYQGPGGPAEDTEDGFALGGWQAPHFDDESGAAIGAGLDRLDALLLGRKTYDIFAGYWPHQRGPIADKFNAVPKFVASRHLTEAAWAGTTVISDVAAELPPLEDRFDEIQVIGSGELVRGLLAAGLLDRLGLFVYPVVLGSGKRLFDGSPPAGFRLAEPARSFPKGALGLVYDWAGAPVTGVTITDPE